MFYDILEKKCKEYPERVSFQDKTFGEKTYGEFWKELERVRAGLEKHGKRIALIGENSYEWALFCIAMFTTGRSVIAIDSLLPAEDIAQLLRDTDAQEALFLFHDEELENYVLKHTEVLVDFTERLLKLPQEDKYADCREDGELIILTSGTSSKSKAVVIPVECLVANALGLEERLALNGEESMYIPIPLSHLYGQNVLMTCLLANRKIYFGKAKNFFRELKKYTPAGVALVPSMAEFVLEHPGEVHNLKMILVAGSKCEKRIQEGLKAQNILLQNQYGMSEFGGAMGCSYAYESLDELYPVAGVNVTLSDDGEILASFEGKRPTYYKGKGELADAWTEGVLATGDLGRLNENGSFSIVGRKKDVIPMKNGNKLYCAEMDEQLTNLAGVREGCVIYVKDRIIAVLVAEENEETRCAFEAFCEDQPYYRRPNEAWYRTEPLPKTAIGKLLRRQVETEYTERRNG